MKRKVRKPVESLKIADIRTHRAWRLLYDDAVGETVVEAVTNLPLRDSADCAIGTEVSLANGTRLWGLLLNVSATDPQATEHFLSLTVFHHDERFVLARYHDVFYARKGPDALATFLGLPIEEVFPISYDIRDIVTGDPKSVSGQILRDPRSRLSKAELIAMSVNLQP